MATLGTECTERKSPDQERYSLNNRGPFLFEVRPLLFGDYPSEWGPSLAVTSVPNVRIANIQAGSPGTWNINFSVVAGTPSGFELWSASTVNGTFAKEGSATIQTIVAGLQYRAVIASGVTQRFYR